MSKNTKLSTKDAEVIANRYAKTEDTLSMIANDYNCSSSTISSAIKHAIKVCLIDLQTAEKIKNKADYNANIIILEKRL